MLESRLCRLPVSGLQHQHGVLANRLARSIAVGQAPDDGAGADFLRNGGIAGCKSGQYSLDLHVLDLYFQDLRKPPASYREVGLSQSPA